MKNGSDQKSAVAQEDGNAGRKMRGGKLERCRLEIPKLGSEQGTEQSNELKVLGYGGAGR